MHGDARFLISLSDAGPWRGMRCHEIMKLPGTGLITLMTEEK